MSDFSYYSSTKPLTEVEARWDRLLTATGCRTQKELADCLDIRQSSVADAKKRGNIPADWLVKLVVQKFIHPNWIMTGEGPRLMHPVEAEDVIVQGPMYFIIKIRPPEECSLKDLISEIMRRCSPRPE